MNTDENSSWNTGLRIYADGRGSGTKLRT